MEGYATMLHDVEKEREEDLLDWVASASDIDESAMEDEQDEEWKTARNSRKRKGKPVEESESQEGGKKKMHTSGDGAECNVKERANDNLCPSGVNRNTSLERADASTNAQSNSGKEKAEKGRAFKPNLGFKSGGIKEESSAVNLGFAGTQCRSHIYVGFTRSAVFPFNAPPRRCYRCQRLGHVAVNCNSPLSCLVCSGPHTKDECTAEPGQEKCANCHQTHIASSKECPAIRNAAAIQKLQRSGVGFEAAKHKVMKTQT
ncbi:Zinc finger CCHC-type [Trinorchestia longiramus]|nr:Zinc finger CCHC-type [Trinorchestia longiramus]